MRTLNLKFQTLILLLMACVVLGSCKDEYDEKIYSSRSYSETYALLSPYVIVNESDEFELDVSKEIIDSLRINPGHIGELKGSLFGINQKTRKALDDYQCSQVFMVTERQGVLIKKTAPNLKYEISQNSLGSIDTRGNVSMIIVPNKGGWASFTGGAQVRTDISIFPGWSSLYVLNFNSKTGGLSDGKNYICFVGTVGVTLTNWWYANKDNGNDTQWSFNATGLSDGAYGSVSFQW